jgi:restriction system protein
MKPIRQLLGVVAHEKAGKGIFATTGGFTQEAIAFAKVNPINSLTCDMLLKGIMALQKESQDCLLTVAAEGNYTTPTCASCGVKLVRLECKNYGFRVAGIFRDAGRNFSACNLSIPGYSSI